MFIPSETSIESQEDEPKEKQQPVKQFASLVNTPTKKLDKLVLLKSKTNSSPGCPDFTNRDLPPIQRKFIEMPKSLQARKKIVSEIHYANDKVYREIMNQRLKPSHHEPPKVFSEKQRYGP